MYLHLLQYFWPQVIRITKVVSNNFWNATKKSPEEPNKVHIQPYRTTNIHCTLWIFFEKRIIGAFINLSIKKKSHNILSSNLY